MAPSPVTYSDVVIKQRIENWAVGLEFNPDEQIYMLFEDKFEVKEITIINARPEGDAMMLTVRTDVWKEPREFALLKSGGLAW